jgi:CO/xanthine dehydrogenase FAD-binding subunit
VLSIDQYLRATSLEEAYEALQRKNSAVLGGMLWLRLGNRRITTAIDLSALGLDQIEVTEDDIRIGAYVSLRTLETEPRIREATDGVLTDAVKDIVGVQFRNMATVGGSIFGRFGFSDVVTACLALNASVELYHAGIMPLSDFCTAEGARDIVTHIRIPRRTVRAAYRVHRNSATDFPALNVCAAVCDGELTVAVGARPLRAVAYRFPMETACASTLAEQIADQIVVASNRRASAEYRKHLCRVMVRRALEEVLEGKEEV